MSSFRRRPATVSVYNSPRESRTHFEYANLINAAREQTHEGSIQLLQCDVTSFNGPSAERHVVDCRPSLKLKQSLEVRRVRKREVWAKFQPDEGQGLSWM